MIMTRYINKPNFEWTFFFVYFLLLPNQISGRFIFNILKFECTKIVLYNSYYLPFRGRNIGKTNALEEPLLVEFVNVLRSIH